jgi:hypothetical protein
MILRIYIDSQGGDYRGRIVTLCERLTAWAEHSTEAELWDFCKGQIIVISDGDGDPDSLTLRAVKLDN